MGNKPARAPAQDAADTEQKALARDRKASTGTTYITGAARNVKDKFIVDTKELGRGHYGVVRKCQDKTTHEWYAIKTIRKSRVGRLESLKREIDILQAVHHPNIIDLVDVYEDDKNLHLVTELCTGGELFDRIIAKTNSPEGHYSERDAALLVQCILEAIFYCHTVHNICHRDLKPENFLFKSPAEDAPLKIIDFGLSRFGDVAVNMTTRVGTPYYIAPEVLGRSYDKACDLWSIGVITYILLCGFPPFYGDSDQEIFASVRKAQFNFPSPEWDSVSEEAKSLVTQLLKKDPLQRPTAAQALEHPWFSKAISTATPIDLRASLHRFMGMHKLKRVALNVIAENLTEADIGHLRQVFGKYDTDGNGVITVDELQEVVQKEGLEFIEAEIAELMKGIDIDGNNTIDWQEFLAATMDRNIFIRDDNIRRAFLYFDADKSGFISAKNLVSIFGSEQHAREVLGDVDGDGDGMISYEEFKAMMHDQAPQTNSPLPGSPIRVPNVGMPPVAVQLPRQLTSPGKSPAGAS